MKRFCVAADRWNCELDGTVQLIAPIGGNILNHQHPTPYVAPGWETQWPTLADLAVDLARNPCRRGRFWFCVTSDLPGLDRLRAAVVDLGPSPI